MNVILSILNWLEGVDPMEDDIEVVARTIYGEARGEPDEGKKDVASVIMNRVKLQWKGDKDAKSVCLHHSQFSCWLDSDPNRSIIMEVTPSDPVYAKCLDIARSAIDGSLGDTANGADSYERIGTDAYWAAGLTPCKVTGHHAFYITRKDR